MNQSVDPGERVNVRTLKVALVHDFLNQQGGAERVLDAFHELWPTAPIFTLIYNQEMFANRYKGARVYPSFLQKLPGFGAAKQKWYLALMPLAIESFDLSGFDLVLSDSSSFAKGAKAPKGVPHVCYLHTPTRFFWSDKDTYLKTAPIPGWARPILSLVMPLLQRWDLKSSKRPLAYIANSNEVAKRLKRYYHRNADAVLFPPVDTRQFTVRTNVKDYWFTVARFEPYKRLDLILDAFAELGWPLKVAGTGSRAKELAKWSQYKNIEFVGRVNDDELATLYGEAKAFVFAANEDAGIVPLEAMAAGRPVLAYGAGGSLESIVPGVTGEFFEHQTTESLVAALKKFKPDSYDPKAIRAHAERFDVQAFTATIESLLEKILTEQKEHHGAA